MDITGWDITEITAAIMRGDEGIDRAIKEKCARQAIATAKWEATTNRHDAGPCKKKQCSHGNEALVRALIDHAATLTQEAQEME